MKCGNLLKAIRGAVCLGIVFTQAVFTAPAILAAPSQPVITAYGSEFSKEGKSFKFVGANIRGLAHYGKGDVLPYTTTAHIDENLQGVSNFGGKVIRLFAPLNSITNEEAKNRVKAVLDKMEPLGLKAIICLTDFYSTSFHPAGDDGYYSTIGSYTILNDTWFKTGYTINYKPFVQYMVNQLKDHNAIFAWEIGNELSDVTAPYTDIIPFTADIAATIKSIDSYHMVTTGFIGIDHLQIGETAGYNLYADPNIDFITAHSYDGSEPLQNRAVHSRLAKPLILEEYGFSYSLGNVVTNTQTQVNKWFNDRAARGFMHWGYQYQTYDIGDGDANFGMDRNMHASSYDGLANIYSTKATEFSTNPPTLPSRLTPLGTNIAASSTAWQTSSDFSAAFNGAKAIDGIISGSNKWTSTGAAPPHWIAIDLGAYKNIDTITLQMGGAGGENVDYNFKNFLIQSSNSLSGSWTTEFTIDNAAQFSFIHSIFASPKSLRYIRAYITNTGIDNYARLPEIEAYESNPSRVHDWTIY